MTKATPHEFVGHDIFGRICKDCRRPPQTADPSGCPGKKEGA